MQLEAEGQGLRAFWNAGAGAPASEAGNFPLQLPITSNQMDIEPEPVLQMGYNICI